MIKNSIVLLKMLLEGKVVIKEDHKYVMSEDFFLCQESTAINSSNKKKRKVLLKVNMGIGLDEFIKWADTFTPTEIIINSANSVLNDMKGIKI